MKLPQDWYGPTTITFSIPQIYWLFKYYDLLKDGKWMHKTSGYIDQPEMFAPYRVNPGAYFEDAIGVIAKLHHRLKLCGKDGELIYCCRCLHYEVGRLIRLMGITQEKMERIEYMVTDYCHGKYVREQTYDEFRRHYWYKLGKARRELP